jgi:hypothetical protein
LYLGGAQNFPNSDFPRRKNESFKLHFVGRGGGVGSIIGELPKDCVLDSPTESFTSERNSQSKTNCWMCSMSTLCLKSICVIQKLSYKTLWPTFYFFLRDR